MTRCLSVSHTSHWITRNTPLKHTIAAQPSQKKMSRRILLGWLKSTNSDLQSCSKKHANKRPLFQTLVTIPTTAFTHFSWWRICHLTSDSLPKHEERKKSRNMRKIQETKRRKSDFTAMILFGRTNETTKYSKNVNDKKVKDRDLKTILFNMRPFPQKKKRPKKKRRDTAWCNGCPAAPRSMTTECT